MTIKGKVSSRINDLCHGGALCTSYLCFTVLKHLQSLFYQSRIITQLTQMVTGHQVTQDLQTHTHTHKLFQLKVILILKI